VLVGKRELPTGSGEGALLALTGWLIRVESLPRGGRGPMGVSEDALKTIWGTSIQFSLPFIGQIFTHFALRFRYLISSSSTYLVIGMFQKFLKGCLGW